MERPPFTRVVMLVGVVVELRGPGRPALQTGRDGEGDQGNCRSPSPDFAVTASEGVSIVGLPLAGGRGIGQDASEGALALGGRNPEVLVAREFMYRACELALNINADAKTTRDIYTKFLQAIKDIAQSQTGTGTAALAGVPADACLPAAKSPAASGNADSDGDDDGDGDADGGDGSGNGSGNGDGPQGGDGNYR
jgi:hypothetical protein